MSDVAERALLVRAGPTGRCAVSASRWGGSERALDAVFAGQSPTALPDVSWTYRGNVADFPSVVAYHDFLSTAALYRVRRGTVTVFLPLWFGLPLTVASATPGVGALVAVDSLTDVRAIRRWFRDLKGELSDALAAGRLSPVAAPTVLLGAIDALDGRERYVTAATDAAEPFYSKTGPDGP